MEKAIMKKIILLFTIVCISTLNGMEPKRGTLAGMWENIPAEVKPLIVIALAQSSNDIDEAIREIIKTSRVNTELNKIVNDLYGNPAGFRNLMQILAKSFPDLTTTEIAKKFKTNVAENYLTSSVSLKSIIDKYRRSSDFIHNTFTINEFENEVKKLIEKGADVNFTWGKDPKRHRLIDQTFASRLYGQDNEARLPTYKEILQILIKYGATSDEGTNKEFNYMVIDPLHNKQEGADGPSPAAQKEINEISNMLNKAMQK